MLTSDAEQVKSLQNSARWAPGCDPTHGACRECTAIRPVNSRSSGTSPGTDLGLEESHRNNSSRKHVEDSAKGVVRAFS